MIKSLPTDVLYKIIIDFSIRKLHRLMRVSKFFLNRINRDEFWEKKLNNIAEAFKTVYPDISHINAKLVAATYCGLTQYAIKYIRNGADVNVKLFHHYRNCNPYFISPIHYAASSGNPATVEALIQHRAIYKPLQGAVYYTSPLHFAVLHNKVRCINFLLEKGADVNQPSGQPFSFFATPLQIAATYNRVNCYNVLRSYNAAIHYGDNKESDQAIHCAIRNKSLDVLKLLLIDGADPNETTEEDPVTPLALACDANHPEILLELLKHGADPRRHMSLFFNHSALHCTLCRKKYDLAKIILDFDSTIVDTQQHYPGANFWDESPLHTAAKFGDVTAIKLLIQYRADPHLLTEGKTAYDFAVAKGNAECGDLLAQYTLEYNFNLYCPFY